MPMAPPKASSLDWSSLPDDVLGLLLERLPVADGVRFGAVCSPWRSAVALRRLRPWQTPSLWLLLSRDPYGGRSFAVAHTCNFLSLPDGRKYRTPLPSSHRFGQCIGSSDGWLVVVKGDDGLCLLSPLSGVVYGLPRFARGSRREGRVLRGWSFFKAVLSFGSPLLFPSSAAAMGMTYTVVIIHRHPKGIAVARGGDESWTLLESPYGKLADVAIHGGTPTVTHVVTQGFHLGTVLRQDAVEMDYLYLVAPPPAGRNLLLAMRRSWNTKFCDDTCRYKTKAVEVFELEDGRWRRKVGGWSRGAALFVGDRFSSFSVEDSAEFGGSRVYVSDEGREHGVGVFDMEGGGAVELRRVKCGGMKWWEWLPIWFTPTLPLKQIIIIKE